MSFYCQFKCLSVFKSSVMTSMNMMLQNRHWLFKTTMSVVIGLFQRQPPLGSWQGLVGQRTYSPCGL